MRLGTAQQTPGEGYAVIGKNEHESTIEDYWQKYSEN